MFISLVPQTVSLHSSSYIRRQTTTAVTRPAAAAIAAVAAAAATAAAAAMRRKVMSLSLSQRLRWQRPAVVRGCLASTALRSAVTAGATWRLCQSALRPLRGLPHRPRLGLPRGQPAPRQQRARRLPRAAQPHSVACRRQMQRQRQRQQQRRTQRQRQSRCNWMASQRQRQRQRQRQGQRQQQRQKQRQWQSRCSWMASQSQRQRQSQRQGQRQGQTQRQRQRLKQRQWQMRCSWMASQSSCGLSSMPQRWATCISHGQASWSRPGVALNDGGGSSSSKIVRVPASSSAAWRVVSSASRRHARWASPTCRQLPCHLLPPPLPPRLALAPVGVSQRALLPILPRCLLAGRICDPCWLWSACYRVSAQQ